MLAQDSPVFHSFSAGFDGERNRPLTNQGEVNLSTFSDSASDPGALPPHQGTTITDLQDLVERQDLAPFVRLALAEYLRANHLPSITYYELSLGEQAKIQSRARELQLRRSTVSTSKTKVAHTPGPWVAVIDPECGGCRDIRNSEEGLLCTTAGVSNDEMDEANAHLIAAAPDLLEALEGVLRIADRKTKEFDAARAAIQKALGGQ